MKEKVKEIKANLNMLQAGQEHSNNCLLILNG